MGFIWPALRYAKRFDERLKRQVQEMLFSVFLYPPVFPLVEQQKTTRFSVPLGSCCRSDVFLFPSSSSSCDPSPGGPPPRHSCSARRGAVPLWLFCSCRTLMGTCLLPLHLLPVATGSLKMTSCCLPVVSHVGL